MSLHETQNLETILSLTGPTGPNDKTCESILDQRTLFCMLIVLASCVIDAIRSEQVVLSHVKKKNSQAVRLKHAAASAESLPSMPQLLMIIKSEYWINGIFTHVLNIAKHRFQISSTLNHHSILWHRC